MTLQEILKAKGLSDEDVESVIGEMKQNKIFTASEENLDIRYGKLKTDHDSLVAQHGESTKLIEQLKAGTKDSEVLQGKITSYEAQVAELTRALTEQKLEAAMDRKLMSCGAKPEDIDYLKFQWKKKGDITLDEHGEIKGADDAIAGMKTQFPVQFVATNDDKQIDVHKLPNRNTDNMNVVTKEEFNKMGYKSKVELKQTNPELYNQLTKG